MSLGTFTTVVGTTYTHVCARVVTHVDARVCARVYTHVQTQVSSLVDTCVLDIDPTINDRPR